MTTPVIHATLDTVGELATALRTVATVATSLAYRIPLGQAATSSRMIHPLRMMLLHPGLAIS
jgi:hypothetical protein